MQEPTEGTCTMRVGRLMEALGFVLSCGIHPDYLFTFDFSNKEFITTSPAGEDGLSQEFADK